MLGLALLASCFLLSEVTWAAPGDATSDGNAAPQATLPTDAAGSPSPDSQARRESGTLADRIDATMAEFHRGPQVPLAGDYEFHRRIYLDLVGRGPTGEETEEFARRLQAGDKSSEVVRNELVDDLLERDEFSRYYAKVLEVMFTERREVIAVQEFRGWIHQWLEQRRPLNEMCTEILAADGTGAENRAAASFILNRQAEPNLVTRDVGRIFLGRDMQCAQCHDHPLVSGYLQSDYYGLLSFVHRTYLFQDEKRGNLPYLGEKSDGELQFASVFEPEAGKSVAQPVLPMAMAMDSEPDFLNATDAYVVAPEKDKRGIPRYSRRQQLAVLATHPENESFNRNLANRLWANMMGMGVVHPVDMHHAGNPPTSSKLLRLLSDELVASQYNLRDFLRQIARSKAYQRSVVLPELDQWPGPPGGLEALEQEAARCDAKMAELKPQADQVTTELAQAAKQVRKYQDDVNRLQTQCDEAKKQLQELMSQSDKEVARSTEVKEKQSRQQQLVDALQAAMGEADKILKLTPEDQELVASRTLLNTRLEKAKTDKATLDSELESLQEEVEDASFRVEDQRSRIFSLVNRRMALGEFVIEARGVQRRLMKQAQVVADAQADCEQQKVRLQTLRDWLAVRDELARTAGDETLLAELRLRQDRCRTELIESWYRSYALRRVRSLTPEQMAGATYIALEMDRLIRAKALSEWETTQQGNPADLADARKRQAFVSGKVAENQWDTVEDLVVTRFSSPAGAPQDGFFATVDQALMIQNDPAFQAWLKGAEGTLIHRLATIEDPAVVAQQLYLVVLGRTPDADEETMVRELLTRYASERAAIVQELVWGLLASTEFRFSM